MDSFQYNELNHLKRCREGLSPGAKEALGAAYHIATTAPLGGQGQFYFNQLLGNLPKYNSAFLMSCASELQSHDLLRIQRPAILMPDHGGVLIESLRSDADL